MLNFIAKLFGGSKSEKDVKKISPIIDKINQYFQSYQSLSNDELRANTTIFRNRIAEYTKDISNEIQTLKDKADTATDIQEKSAIFKQIDEQIKAKDAKLEEVLMQILPEAFATVKAAALRFKENTSLRSAATELDRKLAVTKKYITIEGDDAIYSNTWDAAGSPITWNMVHYDVQLIGGYNLHEGKISEMATGEGKTLVSTLPSYLNGLTGEGVHVVTVNDYLARRDSEWNGTLFEWLGLTVDCIDKHQPNSEQRRQAYLCDIVYGTNNEFGFDYLRDNMVHQPSEMVQRKLHYAMVDEVDSVLIDDARTPLIISGPVPRGDDQEYHRLKPQIERLVDVQRKVVNNFLLEAKKQILAGNDDKEGGGLALLRAHRGLPKNKATIKFLSEVGIKQILQKTENYYLADQQKNMPKVDAELYFTIDEKQNQVDLTQKGLEFLTGSAEDQNFFVMPDISTGLQAIENSNDSLEEKANRKDALIKEYSEKADRIHSIQQLLKAYTLFEKEDEYIVVDGKVKIVDEQTGRILDGRRYSDGLHQAIEAKENVEVEAATQTFATITLQNYFRMYHKLAGMTGTAETEAGEFWQIYKLDVTTIPTNVKVIRDDQEDKVYKTKREKYRAVIEEVKRLRDSGRAVLVGTTSVEVSELLSKMLMFEKVEHNVLNAKQHAREATIVAEAGLLGAITIATNMAGRGTDIKLSPEVKANGGLAIIGTERHESRRVDRQLRGRAGRQGDPGSSQFFVSLEDDLMRLFGSDKLSSWMDRLGHKDGDVIQHKMISRSIERAQIKVEENNFGIRKRLLEYDDVMNAQREVIYTRRKNALFGDRLAVDLDNAFFDGCNLLAAQFDQNKKYEDFKIEVIRDFGFETTISEKEFLSMSVDHLADNLYAQLKNHYQNKLQFLKEQTAPVLKSIFEQNGNRIENIGVPFTDGHKGFQVVANLKKSVETEGHELINALESQVTLLFIDDLWKTHLRQMDEMKQSVQLASYEQKDPLLIYKFEAFNLFKEMISTTNKQIVSFLLKCGIPMQEQQDIQQAEVEKTDLSNMRVNKDEIDAAGEDYAANENDYYDPTPNVKQEPVKRLEPKIGRNDPCPCGSGKKYKQCHGKA
ncbi:MAG TPA: preprotein translocase subunit SecA [Chitinophagaceae bacterium]|nr:MAG: protein translocase subunit secA [Bacteroidetes bacterium OLB11]HMN32610.1 preprotein translocase subunit SecA [Chitinophagaceae bacterium]